MTAPGGLEADDVIAAFSAIGVEQVENVKVRHHECQAGTRDHPKLIPKLKHKGSVAFGLTPLLGLGHWVVQVTIVSSDKDFLQLVTDDVTVFDPFNMARIGPQEVFEKYGVSATAPGSIAQASVAQSPLDLAKSGS